MNINDQRRFEALFWSGLNPRSGLDFLGLSPCCLLSRTKKLQGSFPMIPIVSPNTWHSCITIIIMIKIFLGHTDCSPNSSPRDYINLEGTAQEDKTENMYTAIIIKELLITVLSSKVWPQRRRAIYDKMLAIIKLMSGSKLTKYNLTTFLKELWNKLWTVVYFY